ncbi:formylglycine-generating enzyme family protein [Candidatus Palauibacter sp.]|uniref:formylglycine-generating enzyme family protein n=1 Tax=Candidatus Palauibacter sp. TaxID=3101350 RepID=UPI003B02090C
MMNSTRSRSATAALVVGLAALAAPVAAMGQDLPPAIQVDRYLLQADGYTRDGDARAALAALDRILELQAEHGVEIPDSFWFRHAEAALAAGNAEMAVTSAVRYLELTAQEGEHYVAALELFNEAEALQARFPPGSNFSDCDVCPRMVVVPAGTFTMGSPESEESEYWERPQHSVTIPAPFAVGVYEVTFAEWDACERAGGCDGNFWRDETREYREAEGRHPVVEVDWNDAQAYVSWLSERTGARYRLLTEAEWEYAARAGTQTARYWGESASDQCRYANGFDLTAYEAMGPDLREGRVAPQCSDGYRYMAPVGSFAPNAFGLYDVLGNVAEWTQDCARNVTPDRYSDAPTDGTAAPETGDCDWRVHRGGFSSSRPDDLRSADRESGFSTRTSGVIGFRVARTLN